MTDNNEKPYPPPMLENVNYSLLDDITPLVDLEHGTLINCEHFLEKLEAALSDANMIQPPELIVAHLCCYLGASTAAYLMNTAKQLESSIIELIKQHANMAFAKFNQHPVNGTVSTLQEKRHNLARLNEDSPGNIIVKTMRLGMTIVKMMDRLDKNRSHNVDKDISQQEASFCPQNEFFALLLPVLDEQHSDWQKVLDDKPIIYAINQLSVQIGWLVGYFSHLDNQPVNAGQYLNYGVPCITLYREQMDELLQLMLAKRQQRTSMEIDNDGAPIADPDPLLQEIQMLSSKAHANVPPAMTQFQKDTAIVQAGIEKLLIELLLDGMAIKIVYMSVFLFWFKLDAPLRVDDPMAFEDYSPFNEMGTIIHLVTTTARALPDPELSPELKLLNSKMQALKADLPDPASLDNVDPVTVAEQSPKVNTAIHTLTSDYLKQNYHLEIIANVLFSQWLRLSVFYGVSESDWQKMDYYLPDLLAAVRNYIPSMLSEA